MAITSETQLAQSTEVGYTNYILSRVNDVTGFYKVNTDGSWCGAGTAYLKVADTVVGAREFIGLGDDDETTSINNIGATTLTNGPRYNLAGQKVGESYRGIVIENGKKFVVK